MQAAKTFSPAPDIFGFACKNINNAHQDNNSKIQKIIRISCLNLPKPIVITFLMLNFFRLFKLNNQVDSCKSRSQEATVINESAPSTLSSRLSKIALGLVSVPLKSTGLQNGCALMIHCILLQTFEHHYCAFICLD